MHSPQAQLVVQTTLANVSRMSSSPAFDRMKAFARLLDGRAREGRPHIELRRAWLVRLDGAAIDHRHCDLPSHSGLSSRTTQQSSPLR